MFHLFAADLLETLQGPLGVHGSLRITGIFYAFLATVFSVRYVLEKKISRNRNVTAKERSTI